MKIIEKYITISVAVIAFGGGSLFGVKVLQKKCPDCAPVLECPECPAAVELNTFDFDKINNKKGNFHLHNHLSNVTVVVVRDSVTFNELVKKGCP